MNKKLRNNFYEQMESIEIKRKKVISFYEQFIEGYIIGDLEVLRSINPDPVSGLKGCTIPTAMTIISTIDLLGFLIKEKAQTGESAKNICSFIKFNNLFSGYYDDIAINKICNYRQGMMHHFFPKFKGEFAGICKNKKSNSLFVTENDGAQESLNVSVLVIDFINAVNKFRLFIETTNDEKIFDTILQGLYKIEELPSTLTPCTTINPGTPKNK